MTITGLYHGNPVEGDVVVELAKGKNYIKDWTYVDMRKLGVIDALKFKLTGSKANEYGMTTPAYVAIDNIGAKK